MVEKHYTQEDVSLISSNDNDLIIVNDSEKMHLRFDDDACVWSFGDL